MWVGHFDGFCLPDLALGGSGEALATPNDREGTGGTDGVDVAGSRGQRDFERDHGGGRLVARPVVVEQAYAPPDDLGRPGCVAVVALRNGSILRTSVEVVRPSR